MLLRSTAPHVNKNSKKPYTEKKRLREKNAKCPKSKFNRICLKERIDREKKDLETSVLFI
jgi:hypothetical protein